MAHPQPDDARGLKSNLVLRIVASLVLAPLAIGAAYVGGWPWTALALLASLGLFVEWSSIVGLARQVAVLAGGCATLAILAVASGTLRFAVAAGVLLAGAVLVAALAPTQRRIWSATGLLYAAVALVASIVLRADTQNGFMAIAFVLAVVWATDICGYFVGRSVGGPKLWPRVSPKKTWAGAVGSLGGSIAVALGFAAAGTGRTLALVILGALLSVAAQFGDLAESAVKRRFDVKDSSHIIPGHGGLMDRLDGFIAAVAVAALIGVCRAGPDAAGQGLLLW